jgi:hypothetical protein
MRTEKDVEAYLERMNRSYQTVENEKGTYLVYSSASMPPIAVRVDPPLIVMRVRIADGGSANVALLRRLLEYNAESLVHSAYGLEKEHIVLTTALELENLDMNELQAALDEMDLALAQQVPLLVQLARAESTSPRPA